VLRSTRRRGRDLVATGSGTGSTVLVMQQTQAAPPATLDAVLERITYANEETGYTVARVATDRSSDLLTVVGPLLGAQPGESCACGAGGPAIPVRPPVPGRGL
jgi:hypothetical protein